ncbi:PEP-CTERM sorting domain-containing protein [Stieleria sp. TO1_6]|uniref:PEP-CTERM sorting domain-containing protein n=1 Tax=Stieleria tagensis TaxID=2956795 RepID=UPI00209B04C2|nr:PEP-CTERM sorting domain-containing protein [Stieleria tagensis]MCO8120687.1 PEP-CTERM sorting domain-containing protein [Stieleria tagensis]
MPVVVGTAADKANVLGFLNFDFTGVSPVTIDSGTLTISSSVMGTPTVVSEEVDFGAPTATGTLDPTSGQPPFTYVFDIVGGLISATSGGMFQLDAVGAAGQTYLAIITVPESGGGGGSVVPEPGTLSMLALGGLVGCCGLVRRRRN